MTLRALNTKQQFNAPDAKTIQDSAVRVFGEDFAEQIGALVRGLYDDLIVLDKVERVNALPTADVSLRGKMLLLQGGAGVADLTKICRKNAADAYEWQTL